MESYMTKKRLFFIFGLTIFFITSIIFFYFNKKYTINFSAILPKKFILCNKEINENNPEYKILKNWLISNQQGWKNTLATYAPTIYFFNTKMTINIQTKRIIINYEDFNKNLHQLIHKKNANELNFCIDNNTSNLPNII